MTRLTRSRNDKWFAGVCGGLGQYLGVDSSLVRLFFVLLTFANGIGILVYLVMAIIVPNVAEGEELTLPLNSLGDNRQASYLIGGALILLGLFFFLDNLNLPWLRWMDFDLLWPVALIAAGGFLVARVLRQGT